MRLFVAIIPSRECLMPISSAAKPLEGALGARVLPQDNWHITLKFIGEADGMRAERIGAALASIRFQPFSVSLFGAGAFPSERVPRAIWIGGESKGAVGLAAEIEDALSFLGLPHEPFSVHLTVARSKGVADIGEFVAKAGGVCEFEARSFFLMKSKLTPAGASYEVIREFHCEEPSRDG